MKIHGYKNMKFNKYEVTASGSVYRRDGKGGALRRIKGAEAKKVRTGLAAQIRAEAAVIQARIDNKKAGGPNG